MPHAIARTLLAATLATTAVIGLDLPVEAATAHNSQAGSWGPTSDNCAPTPYFPAGGCVSAAIQDEGRYPSDVPAPRYRPGHRLVDPGALPDPYDR